MLTAYFDESGTHAGSPVLTVAGYVATVEQWDTFDRAWAQLLKDEQLPAMHWTDLESRKAAFEGWTKERKLAVQKRAIAIICETVERGFATGVVLADYLALIGGLPETIRENALAFAVVDNLKMATKWATLNCPDEPMNYVFESGGGYGGELSGPMSMLSKKERWEQLRMTSPKSLSFCAKKTRRPLQAADVLAYEAYKHVLNQKAGGVRRGIRLSLEALLVTEHDNHYYNGKNLRWLMEGLREEGLL